MVCQLDDVPHYTSHLGVQPILDKPISHQMNDHVGYVWIPMDSSQRYGSKITDP